MNRIQDIKNILKGELVNPATGEIIEGAEIIEALEFENALKKRFQRDGLKYKKEKSIVESKVTEMLGGSFYILQYRNTVNAILEKYEKINSAFAFRFIYLCSYMNYDNILIFDSFKRSKSKYIDESDLREIMNLSRKQLIEFKKICFEDNLLEKIEVEGIPAIKVNKMVACKGKTPTYYNRYSIRVSINHIQEIYKMATAREHKQLGYLVSLLPYVNFHFSILSHNPECEYKTHLNPLSLQDICKILDYDIKNAGRLLTALRKPTLNGKLVFLTVLYKDSEAFLLNPAVYNKVSSNEALKWLYELLESSEIWTNNKAKRKNGKIEVKSLKEMCISGMKIK